MVNAESRTDRILVIDDDLALRKGCRRALSRYGFQVDVAATGRQGLSKIQEHDYSLALIDVMMPDIGGLELLATIREQRPDIICIIITGYATVELAVDAMKQGAYDFIAKPFSDDNLFLAVQKGLERRRLEQEAHRLQRIEEEARRLSQEKTLLEELDRVRSASMRQVAHELRAPIAAIRSFLTLILQGYSTPAKTKEWQQRAADRADDLLRLIDDMLNLARLKDPAFVSAEKAVSVEAILEDVLGLHTPEAEAKKIRIKVNARPCGMIMADPMHIKQLWTNLISNAIKYTPRGKRVTVSLFPERQTIVGVVKDTGIGIGEEDFPHLFEEFFRTEQAKAFTQRGTGLGLSIVSQIIQHYGGEISVESKLGKGTQFTFRLPRNGGRTGGAILD
jgi:two-component system sensor histidine kinase/response regulator